MTHAWQPMKDAPKDGTRVLAFTDDAQHPAVHETWWFDDWWRFYSKDDEKFMPPGVYKWFPTHWTPLPTATTEAS